MFFSLLKFCGHIHNGVTIFNTSIIGKRVRFPHAWNISSPKPRKKKWKLLQPLRLCSQRYKKLKHAFQKHYQGSSNRGSSSLLSLVLGSFFTSCCVPRSRDSSYRSEVLASAKDTLALVSETLDYEMEVWTASLPIGSWRIPALAGCLFICIDHLDQHNLQSVFL